MQDNVIPLFDNATRKVVLTGISRTSSTTIRNSLLPIMMFEVPCSCHKKVSPPSEVIFLSPTSKGRIKQSQVHI